MSGQKRSIFAASLGLGAALPALLFASAALAQTPAQQSAQADSSTAADEIIVTARRREESLQDVPLVVNALTAETLEDLNIRNFQEITAVVPGLSLVPNANGIGSSSSMRGINHDVNVSGENGTIQYYLNDAPVPSNLILQAMYDVGQVEVQRGPQGTLRGRSTPSGSIAVTTRRPDLNEFGGTFQGLFASDDALNFQAAANVPIIPGRLAIRIAGLSDINGSNRVTSVNSGFDPERTTESVRASVWAEPFDALSLGFTYQTLEANVVEFDQMQSFSLSDPAAIPSATAPDYGVINPEDRRSVSINPRRVGQEFEFFGLNAEFEIAGQSLYYVGQHQTSDFHPITPNDTSNFFPTLAPVQDVTTTSESTTHELRLQSNEPIAGMFDYVVGYFRNEGKAETFLTTASILRLFGFIPPSITFSLGQPPFINNTAIFLPQGVGVEESFFANGTAHLGDATEISGGMRLIQFENERPGLFISCTRAQFAAGTCTAAVGTQDDTSLEETIYNASITHRLTDSLMVYAATGTSWRPPVQAIGDFTNAPYTPNEQAHINLGAETSTSYEIGVKSDWFDNTFLFNATAYHQEFDNYPFRAAGAGIFFININSQLAPERSQFNFISAVPVEVDGFEADFVFNPSDRFNIASTISYSKSEIGSALLACTDALNNGTGAVGSDGIPDVVAPTLAELQAAYGTERLAECQGGGQPANFLPEWSGSVTAEFTQPMDGGNEAYLRGLLTWRGESLTDPNNPFDDVQSYGLLNLYAGLRDADGGWDFSLFAKNVTDETQITSRDAVALSTGTVDVLLLAPTFTSPGGTRSTTFTSRYSGVSVTPPREIGVALRFFFGSR